MYLMAFPYGEESLRWDCGAKIYVFSLLIISARMFPHELLKFTLLALLLRVHLYPLIAHAILPSNE